MMVLAIAVNLLPVFLTAIAVDLGRGSPLSAEQLGRIGAVTFIGLVGGILVTGPLAYRLAVGSGQRDPVSVGDDFDFALDASIARDQAAGGLCFELTTILREKSKTLFNHEIYEPFRRRSECSAGGLPLRCERAFSQDFLGQLVSDGAGWCIVPRIRIWFSALAAGSKI